MRGDEAYHLLYLFRVGTTTFVSTYRNIAGNADDYLASIDEETGKVLGSIQVQDLAALRTSISDTQVWMWKSTAPTRSSSLPIVVLDDNFEVVHSFSDDVAFKPAPEFAASIVTAPAPVLER